MKVLILYRPNSEYARRVEEFVHDFKRWHPESRVEVEDVDTHQGMALSTLYDIMAQPAILALREDGQLMQSWEGDNFPLMDELAYFAKN